MSLTQGNWHDQVFFGIHYDLHANAKDKVLGKELTASHLRQRLLLVKPDWIQCDCKGHPGYTSWPTRTGSTSPGVVKDALRLHRQVTRQLGIKLGMHYSGVLDSRAIELHPSWARRDENGKADTGMTCRLSGYGRELMIPQLLEIIDRYDVDGFWVDGENWASKPCWCERCRTEFSRRTGVRSIPRRPQDRHWDLWLAFHRDLFVEHVARYSQAVHARKPGCLVCSNWMYTLRQPDVICAPVDYLSGDYDWAWGANRAAVEGRVLDSRGLSWDLMAWGFSKTGDMGKNPPWVMKTATHLCQEVAEVVALGGAIMIYNTPQRTGWLTGWHQQLLAQVADFCRQRKNPCFKSTTVPQAAILHLPEHHYSCNNAVLSHNEPLFSYGVAALPVEGALHALLETHHSTDVLVADAVNERLGQYKLVVLPEQTRLSRPLVASLEAYAAAGGHVLMSGSHLSRRYGKLVGARPVGRPIQHPVFLSVDDAAVAVSGPWQVVKPTRGVKVWATRLNQQEPAKDRTRDAVVTWRKVGRGSILAIHGPVFNDYLSGHYPLLRRFVANLVDRLPIRWMVQVQAPPRVEMILRQKDGKLLVNLINRGAGETLSPGRVIVDELPPVHDITLRIRRPKRPQSVRLAPGNRKLKWSYAGGAVTARIPRLDIHSVVVVE